MNPMILYATTALASAGRKSATCMHVQKILLAGLLLLSPLVCVAQTQASPWEWSEKAVFLTTHDPMVIQLDGDRELEVIYDAVRYEDVEKWPEGKSMQLAYSAKTGAVLIDPDNGKFLPVITGLKQHPIDAIITRCTEAPETKTTLDIRNCYTRGYALWDAEMNLWYGRLMASKSPDLLDDAGKHMLQQAQVQWLCFRDAEIKVIVAIYSRRDGTIWGQVAQQKKIELTKQQALQLASYFKIF